MNQPGESKRDTNKVPADAVLAGAVAATSLILLILGSGLGWFPWLAWTLDSAIATSFGLSMILWITLGPLFAPASIR